MLLRARCGCAGAHSVVTVCSLLLARQRRGCRVSVHSAAADIGVGGCEDIGETGSEDVVEKGGRLAAGWGIGGG